MINNKCSFSKFNDLMGIHKVIFDSLIDGKSFAESVTDVKTKYMQRMYGKDLSLLGTDVDGVIETLSDVASAISLAIPVIQEANENLDNQLNVDLLTAVNDINTSVSGWQAEYLANLGAKPTTNIESRSEDEEVEDTTPRTGFDPQVEQ